MGRSIFHYNRFGQEDSSNNAVKKDISRRDYTKSRQLKSATNSRRPKKSKTLSTCPAYAELYPEYRQQESETETETEATTAGVDAPTTSSTFMSSSTTAKSIELAFKKYHEWSNRFLTNAIQATTATTTTTKTVLTATECSHRQSTPPSTTKPSNKATSTGTSSGSFYGAASSSSADSSSGASSSSSCSSSSSSCGYHSQQYRQSSDTELLVTTTRSRKPKVYDCMKDFLKRKLFHQPTQESRKSVKEEEDEATSDYDEIDMLDSSYNADEEYDTDTDSTCTCPPTDECQDDPTESQLSSSATHTLNSWSNTTLNTATATLSTSSDEDSDAGISDCCQLLSERSPKRRSPFNQQNQKQQQQQQKPNHTRQQRYNITEDDELLEATWYQPHLSSKAAAARLLHAEPGAFLLSRKPRNFELSLRLQSKVQHFVVLSCNGGYKFKGAKKQFSSLRALVTHHSVMAEHLPLTLTLPRPQKPKQVEFSLRCADDFDTYESLQLLGILKCLQADNWENS